MNAAEAIFQLFLSYCGKKATLSARMGASGGDDVDNTVAPFFELMQERRQHPGCLGFGIVKQHDAPAHLVDTGQDQP